MDFHTALAIELDKYSARMNRAQVCKEVYWTLKNKGFNPVIVNDKGFEESLNDGSGRTNGRTFWMRRNNKLDCWQIA